MFSQLNAVVGGALSDAKFVTNEEIADVVESYGAVLEVVADAPNFVVMKINHPTKGHVFTVCSVAGANLVLKK